MSDAIKRLQEQNKHYPGPVQFQLSFKKNCCLKLEAVTVLFMDLCRKKIKENNHQSQNWINL
jgi:hypothetical protein